MISTKEALESWKKSEELGFYKLELENGYEILLEPLIFDEQWYLAIYKNQFLVAPKVVVRVGKKEDYQNPIEVK